MPVIIVATVTPLPEHRDEVKAVFVAAVGQVHGEDGCSCTRCTATTTGSS